MLQKGVDVVPEDHKALLPVFQLLLLRQVPGRVQLSQELLQWPQVFFTLGRGLRSVGKEVRHVDLAAAL